ncbi:MAG: cation transporter, partial [Clostridia bacterium]|nr:cation transporter [Clostridia bacterium]
MNTLFKLFIKDYKNTYNEDVRNRYGILGSVTGIILNIFLFVFKLVASVLTASIGIAADALNNLSDAGSSIITFIGFRLSGKPADRDHPFGHGRAEYICAMFVSMLILFMGFELCKSSVSKIIKPQSTQLDTASVVILIAAVLTKGWMYLFNRKIGKAIDSKPIIATAKDSLSDAVATTAVLLGLLIEKLFDINVDGYTGLLVSIFILYTGVGAIKDSMSPLLGSIPDKELVAAIKDTIMAHDEIVGIHDMVIHNYGPTRFMMSVHAEVPCDVD